MVTARNQVVVDRRIGWSPSLIATISADAPPTQDARFWRSWSEAGSVGR